MVHVGTFEPGKAVGQLRDEQVTVAFPAFETIWLPILDHPEFSKDDVPALRLVINVGTPERMRLMEAAGAAGRPDLVHGQHRVGRVLLRRRDRRHA